MTCIAAAFRSPTEYALGADSCREWRGTRTIGYKPKRWGPCLFATAGSAPTGEALAGALMALDPPDGAAHPAPSTEAWRAAQDVEAKLREAFAKVSAGVQPQPGSTMPSIDAELLLVGPTGVYLLAGDGMVLNPGKWWAIGSGGAEARGVLWALYHDPRAHSVVLSAVNAAIEMDVGCFGPPVVVKAMPTDGG